MVTGYNFHISLKKVFFFAYSEDHAEKSFNADFIWVFTVLKRALLGVTSIHMAFILNNHFVKLVYSHSVSFKNEHFHPT